MDTWQTLVSTALVGTDRQTPNLKSAKGALSKTVAQIEQQTPEKALLDAASAIALHQQTGWRPLQKSRSLFPPFEGDDLPCCNPRIMQYLEEASHAEIEIELLEMMSSVGQRVPAKWLPNFLARAKRSRVRPYFMAVIGRRGQWLAAQNPAWNFVAKYFEDCPQTAPSEKPSGSAPAGTSFSQLTLKRDNQTVLEWLEKILIVAPRWNMEDSTIVLNHFFTLAKNSSHHIALSSLCIRLGLAVHPGLHEEIARQIHQIRTGIHHTLEKFLDELHGIAVLRYNIYAAFLESG